MPKNKTHSGASKRFKITGSGKVLRERAGKRHLLEHKSSTMTRSLTGTVEWLRPTPRRSRSFSASEARASGEPGGTTSIRPGPIRFRAA